ncbi:class I SAM-dependent methyltransferase [Kaistia dalseonensis]|uniref:NADH dehydrogenase [ubiquinone] 1 alpha subcomplex assembly factor 7 n=1 Tax=Kaistia dalseonensis TaxID=410840 RepID=A0ABU0H7L0_9HYPH|nr:class I SAM-dependent methyltransferase [Kaistia dalseonensis]MCX5495185.1 class I SAM-dependent methyltransferase [Kaistia dalseonensis]MDQ0437770.1 NADH dehydrogenase [ubiquinone] 1 alpha subcomplex assembly factor 7 [Kaistia dalseonensis]
MTQAGATLTPLGERLLGRIENFGPITIADYMAACLGDPEHGYYMAREPFGTAGDFITAPEVSQMFGELIGLWAVETWNRMGRPDPFVLAELGPGRGTLMADALRAARAQPAFEAAARIVMVETSPRLRARQQATLAAHDIAWADRIEDLPDGPVIIIANEFFDALPVRQFLRVGTGWAERMVGVEDGRLIFGLRPDAHFEGADPNLPDGALVEIASVSAAIMAAIAERLVRFGGALLAIDYGHAGIGTGDTLQAVRAHQFDDPLAHPGEADLTVHVDFGLLARIAAAHGATPAPIWTQGDFLLALGLLERAGRLGAGKDAETQDAIRSAVARLAGPEAMGTLFKVLAVAAPGLALPPFA